MAFLSIEIVCSIVILQLMNHLLSIINHDQSTNRKLAFMEYDETYVALDYIVKVIKGFSYPRFSNRADLYSKPHILIFTVKSVVL